MSKRTRNNYLKSLPDRYRRWLTLKKDYGLTTLQVVCAYRMSFGDVALRGLLTSWKHDGISRDLGQFLEERYAKKIGRRLPNDKVELETLLVEKWKDGFKGRPRTGRPRIDTPKKSRKRSKSRRKQQAATPPDNSIEKARATFTNKSREIPAVICTTSPSPIGE